MTYSNWFIKPKPKANPALRLICFSYAGGSAATYIPWVQSLPNNVELVAIQLPGRASRLFESPYSDMDVLVKELIIVLNSLLDRPYILFGHSLGSRIAFEFMVRCQEANLRLPAHFIASGSRGPQFKSNKAAIHTLTDNEFIEELKALNGTPSAVLENEELMEIYLPLLRADFQLAADYCFDRKNIISCPVTVLGGDIDADISLKDLQSWGEFFSYPVNTHILRGDHFFIESNSRDTIEKVNTVLQLEFSKLT